MNSTDQPRGSNSPDTEIANHQSSRGLFVTGNDTGVGKTYVATRLARRLREHGLDVGVYKPVASGCRRQGGKLISDDAVALWEAAGRPRQLDFVCPQCFEAALAPPLAAAAEGKEIDSDLIRNGLEKWNGCDFLIVEGVGGLMSPLSEDDYVADFASELNFPLLMVAANRIGVINQTLQSLITASVFRDGLDVAGVVLNDVEPMHEDVSCASNFQQLIHHCVPPVVAHVGHGGEFENLDWLLDESSNAD